MMSEWISVKDRLPEESTALEIKEVLLFHRGRVVIGHFICDQLKVHGSPSSWNNEIDWWMPMPEPPKQ
jgi:hypothetical protein